MFQRISLFGLGYIGLPTATLFASRRKQVIGVDVDPNVVSTINQGNIHIVEPELDMLVRAAVREGHLRATLIPEPADAFLVAVPTPFKDGHKPDLAYIEAAATGIAPVLRKGNLVILESTSPVGSTEQMAQWLALARPDLSFPQQAGENADIQVAYCPERVLPGRVLRELVRNDRVIGGLSEKASHMAVELYQTFVEGACVITDARTAEMCKLTENSFRDVNIAFANELSLICDRLGINVWELIRLANRHPRVNILQPGPGVGGHCIAVDPWFIVDKTPEEARLIRLAREVNDGKPHRVVEKVKAMVTGVLSGQPGKNLADLRIACLGLSFKPDIDDLRESPAVEIATELAGLPCEVIAVEPHIRALPAPLKAQGIRLEPLESALESADLICVLVKHALFVRAADKIAGMPYLVDAVGLLG